MSPPSQPRTFESGANPPTSPSLRRPFLFKHQQVPSTTGTLTSGSSNSRAHPSASPTSDEGSWGMLGSEDLALDHDTGTSGSRDTNSNPIVSQQPEEVSEEVSLEQPTYTTPGKETSQNPETQESAFPWLRRHYAEAKTVKRTDSGYYPSMPNENFRRRPFQSSFDSGMSALENWVRDPRSTTANEADTSRDFEKTNPPRSAAPAYKGRMSVLDNWDKSTWGKNAVQGSEIQLEHSATNSNVESQYASGPVVGTGLDSLQKWTDIKQNKGRMTSVPFKSANSNYRTNKDRQQPSDGYNIATEYATYHPKNQGQGPEIAVQQNFRNDGRLVSHTRRPTAQERKMDFVDEVAARRTTAPPRKSKSRRSPGKDEEDNDANDLEGFEDGYGEGRSRKRNKKGARKQPVSRVSSRPASIHLPQFITVERLASALHVELGVFLRRLRDLGYEDPAYDHILDYENSSLICQEFNLEPLSAIQSEADLVSRPPPDKETLATLPHRPPIVTIMGHVDHGKTTILDWLRKSSVAASEHGGITQHIGAFSVRMPGSEKMITFLDTPGHAAFLEMRRRGATVTDIVVLVVAADDSVKPQTLEAIKHAQESKVAVIVAINKVDKEDANVDRVKQDLARQGIDVESYGGETQAISVSGKTGQGMIALEEAIIAEAENLQTRVEFDGPAEGWVIEASMGEGGRFATVLVRRGTLRPRDIIVAGNTWSRVRSLRNDAGVLVDSAPPGTPVVVDGWRDQPDAGAEVIQASSEDQAKRVVDVRTETQTQAQMARDASAINVTRREEAEARTRQKAWESEQEWFAKPMSRHPRDNVGWVDTSGNLLQGPKRIDILVKADVAGSVEAVVNAVSSIGNNEVATNVVDSGVGPVNESDIEFLAATRTKAFIVSFNQQDDGLIMRRAEAAGVPILSHTIIYKVTDDLTERLAKELPPNIIQKVQGEAEIGQVFTINAGKKNATKIAGSKVTNGLITRDRRVKVLRSKEVVFTGTLDSLKHLKKDVTESRSGTECGMGFDGWDDFQVGDRVQSFDEKQEQRQL
ncbi:MAG: hypothetical protein Q9160_001201 [Pyrenula sp. 1 TL-2023]